MTIITAPPDRDGLVLDQGDVLVVENHGLATNTVVNMGGRLDLVGGGVSDHAIINAAGAERVNPFSTSNDSVINRGGREYVDRGVSNGTHIVGGVEIVDFKGHANDTTISGSGRLDILGTSDATNVTFAGQGRNSVQIEVPANLKGTISGWHVGDFVDLLDIRDVSVSESGNVLTVKYREGREDLQTTYTLANQQSDTHFVVRPDGHNGTDIVLVAGAQPHHHEFFF